MSLPVLFEFETLPVRVLTREDGELWFIARDVATALEYRDAGNMARNLDEDEKGTHIVSTLGGEQGVLIINEAGLYSAILRSRKPAAKRFKRWVTHEVLPTIRKTGSYQMGGQGLHNQIGAHRLRLELLERLYRTHDREMRVSIHEQLASVSRALGLSTPAIESIGHAAPTAPDILKVFWQALAHLDGKGVAYNHASASSSHLGFNTKHLRDLFKEHGITLTIDRRLFDAFRASRQPEFVGYKTVESSLAGKSVKCWVFERPVTL